MNNINGMFARYSNVKKQQTLIVINYYEEKIYIYDIFLRHIRKMYVQRFFIFL